MTYVHIKKHQLCPTYIQAHSTPTASAMQIRDRQACNLNLRTNDMHYQLSDVIPRKHERSRYRQRYDDCQVDRAKTRLRMLAWVPHGWSLRCSTTESWELERNKGQIYTYHVSRWFRILSNITHCIGHRNRREDSRAICDCSDPVSYVILPYGSP